MTPEELIASVSKADAAADRLLTVAECALQLNIGADFIVGEIKDGRLNALRYRRPSGRTRYRVRESWFAEYVATHWPNVSRATT